MLMNRCDKNGDGKLSEDEVKEVTDRYLKETPCSKLCLNVVYTVE